ncbi:hypothetical protein KFK09_028309 [Dendrobium nobile]|uniref:Uncharacterized protein n=1 Tax=Dendrobium nobile TaxID=94219 RepID=A0A8T3A2A5_DENNO|nr:hypothetical protein KFK09_028309 [Dendrobium nobile]
MASMHSSGTNQLMSKGSNNLVIREGARPSFHQDVIAEGKCKKVMFDRAAGGVRESVKVKVMHVNMNLEASSSTGLILKGNKFLSNNEKVDGQTLPSDIKALGNKETVDGNNHAKNYGTEVKQVNIEEGNGDKNGLKEEFFDAWKKPQHIKISFNKDLTEMSEDGIAVKLNAEKEILNSQVLKYSLVIKVLGDKISFPMCSIELRIQWNKFGNFHMTSLRMN